MEDDMGLNSLGVVQKNIVYAVTLILQQHETVETGKLRSHKLLDGTSRSAFFRALRDLVDKGYIKHNEGAQRSSYTLTEKLK
ncbi:hypothetical protein [Octadecabacter antarcticus]|nr:hypothetical protein [Octadecabacter antarcticus]